MMKELMDRLDEMGFYEAEQEMTDDVEGIINLLLYAHSFRPLLIIAGREDDFPALFHHAEKYIFFYTRIRIKKDRLIVTKEMMGIPGDYTTLERIIRDKVREEYNSFMDYAQDRVIDVVRETLGLVILKDEG